MRRSKLVRYWGNRSVPTSCRCRPGSSPRAVAVRRRSRSTFRRGRLCRLLRLRMAHLRQRELSARRRGSSRLPAERLARLRGRRPVAEQGRGAGRRSGPSMPGLRRSRSTQPNAFRSARPEARPGTWLAGDSACVPVGDRAENASDTPPAIAPQVDRTRPSRAPRVGASHRLALFHAIPRSHPVPAQPTIGVPRCSSRGCGRESQAFHGEYAGDPDRFRWRSWSSSSRDPAQVRL